MTDREALLALADRCEGLVARILKANEGTAGEYFADGDEFKLIFRPGGGSYAGGDRVVALCACGGLAGIMPGLLASAMNLMPDLAAALRTHANNEQGEDRG